MAMLDRAMYTVTVRREFIAQHYLTVPDPGPEGDLHSHAFTLELRFSGPELDEYGYLVDIDELEAVLDDLLARYRDATLNDLPEFAGENPSVENFARHVADRVVDDADVSGPESLTVRLWEDETAWAAYETAL
jgi:6-pyruvoyltetrahydropterin/6-carboxytetrahydropterin synthase